MKTILAVTDLDPALNADMVAVFETVARSPRERTRGLRVLHDWRDVAVRYLRRKFPHFWIYRGGRHIAVHASPPEPVRHRLKIGESPWREAGRCLARIIEVTSRIEAHEAHKNRTQGQCALPV